VATTIARAAIRFPLVSLTAPSPISAAAVLSWRQEEGSVAAICAGIAPMTAAGSPGALGEHPQDDLEPSGGDLEVGVELDAGEKRPPERGDEAGRESDGRETIGRAGVGPPQQLAHGMGAHVENEARRAQLVVEGSHGRAQRRDQLTGAAEGVADALQPLGGADDRAGGEGAEAQRLEIEALSYLGIGGQQDLESAIEQESVDRVGAYAPPDPVRSFEHGDLDSGARQILRADEPGEACADDHDTGHLRRRWPGDLRGPARGRRR
jgi:hypothetical protein